MRVWDFLFYIIQGVQQFGNAIITLYIFKYLLPT